MAGVAEFLAALKGGGARPNRFEVVVNIPAFAGGSDVIRQTAFLVQSTSLPGANLGTIEQGFRGRQLKLAGDRTFMEWECTFVNDTTFEIHDSMERWSNAINSYNTNVGFLAPSDYMSSVSVYQLDNQDNRIKEKVMKMAWPSIVTQIDLAQDSNDILETFSVTFQYSDIDNGNST